MIYINNLSNLSLLLALIFSTMLFLHSALLSQSNNHRQSWYPRKASGTWIRTSNIIFTHRVSTSPALPGSYGSPLIWLSALNSNNHQRSWYHGEAPPTRNQTSNIIFTHLVLKRTRWKLDQFANPKSKKSLVPYFAMKNPGVFDSIFFLFILFN